MRLFPVTSSQMAIINHLLLLGLLRAVFRPAIYSAGNATLYRIVVRMEIEDDKDQNIPSP